MGLPMSADVHQRHTYRMDGAWCFLIQRRGEVIGQVSFLPEAMPRRSSVVMRRFCRALDEAEEE